MDSFEFAGTAADAPVTPLVLVVDDDPAGVAATLDTLEAGGIAAVGETEGDAALQRARGILTRVAVSELYVASADGPCVVAPLKQDRARLPRLGVLVYTRHTSEADTAWALAAGCDGLVRKPARPGVLVREVRRLDGGLEDQEPPDQGPARGGKGR